MAEIAKAGIDSKGAKIDNELPTLKDEYTQYRKETKLWENSHANQLGYKAKTNNILRITKDEQGNLKEEIFYGE